MITERDFSKESESLSLVAILFSMNRALQLDATLRSFLRHCKDADHFDIYVIYKTTAPTHLHQYLQLIRDYEQYNRIHFFQEANFRTDVLDLLFDKTFSNQWSCSFKAAARMGGLLGRITSRWIRSASSWHVLFLVDDNIFTGEFYLSDALQALKLHTDALGFSLRLGENTNFCYAHDRSQVLPHFDLATPGILKFDWTKAEHDFHYPLEVSSSIYRVSDMLPMINSRSFSNPNELEGKMAASSAFYKCSHPCLLCYTRSVCFCNPINRVQDRVLNRTGVVYDYPAGLLAEKFDAGYCIDVAALDGFISTGCHQEVEFQFIRHEP